MISEKMIYVIFEVVIKKDYMDQYLNLAAKLKRHVEANKGFVRSERFSSLVDERKLLSLSVWENEDYLNEWRNQIDHRLSQKEGRDNIFESYTTTVTSKLRCYTNNDRAEVPDDSNDFLNG